MTYHHYLLWYASAGLSDAEMLDPRVVRAAVTRLADASAPLMSVEQRSLAQKVGMLTSIKANDDQVAATVHDKKDTHANALLNGGLRSHADIDDEDEDEFDLDENAPPEDDFEL